jgi:predicted transcriptional regulator
MPDEINFLDLAALARITPDSVVEKFGGVINSSFFDASSILATLKQKGLIDFTTAFPGQSAITITDLGKQLLNDAHDKANTPFDQLDLAILTQLSAGKRNVKELNQSVNVTQKDFALRIYKLAQNAFLSYDVRNGDVSVALTEKGFLQVKSGMPPQPAAAGPAMGVQQAQQLIQQGFQQHPQQQDSAKVQAAPAASTHAAPGPAQQATAAATGSTIPEIEAEIRSSKKRRDLILGVVAIVVVVAVVYVLMLFKMVSI